MTESASGTSERLSVNISPLTAASVRTISTKRGTTITETIRRAAAVLKLLEDAQAEGTELRLVNPRTKETRIIELI